jgi:hypothetical protein
MAWPRTSAAFDGRKSELLNISKKGNEYLRRLFIHGARSVMARTKRDRHRFGEWISRLETRAHHNKVGVALANKLARVAWAVLHHSAPYIGAGPVYAGLPNNCGKDAGWRQLGKRVAFSHFPTLRRRLSPVCREGRDEPTVQRRG